MLRNVGIIYQDERYERYIFLNIVLTISALEMYWLGERSQFVVFSLICY